MLLDLVFGATLLWAGDKPWKAKPYHQWHEKDLQTIVSDSPWVRTTPIERHMAFRCREGLSTRSTDRRRPETNAQRGHEKEVQFSGKIADSPVRVVSRPQEMVDQSGPAL